MIVVADTGPINYLVQLELAPVLLHLYDSILLPLEVWRELRHESAPSNVRLWAAQLPSQIRVQKPELAEPKELRLFGAGERAAITLSLEYSAELILIDERRARAVAETHLPSHRDRHAGHSLTSTQTRSDRWNRCFSSAL